MNILIAVFKTLSCVIFATTCLGFGLYTLVENSVDWPWKICGGLALIVGIFGWFVLIFAW